MSRKYGGNMAIETEGDWKCPKCDGADFYKEIVDKLTTGNSGLKPTSREVRKCSTCQIPMRSESTESRVNNAGGAAFLFITIPLVMVILYFIFK
jgi:hypothetical protein